MPAEALGDPAGSGEPHQRSGELLDRVVRRRPARRLGQPLVAGAADQAELGRQPGVLVGEQAVVVPSAPVAGGSIAVITSGERVPLPFAHRTCSTIGLPTAGGCAVSARTTNGFHSPYASVSSIACQTTRAARRSRPTRADQQASAWALSALIAALPSSVLRLGLHDERGRHEGDDRRRLGALEAGLHLRVVLGLLSRPPDEEPVHGHEDDQHGQKGDDQPVHARHPSGHRAGSAVNELARLGDSSARVR